MTTVADINLADQPGALFRGELNEVLLALATGFQDDDEPATTYPSMRWVQPSTGMVFRRNHQNTAWIAVADIASGILAAGATEIAAGANTVKTVTPAALSALWKRGTDLTAATNLELPDTEGGYYVVNGTTTIATIEGRPPGWEIELRFAQNPQLTHSGNLILLGGAPMVMGVGDMARFRSEGGGVWRMSRHARAAAPAPEALIAPGIIVPYGGFAAPSGWLLCYGQTVLRSAYPDLFAALVRSLVGVSFAIQNPTYVTWPGHGLQENDPVKFTTTGGLPGGVSIGTTYYVNYANPDQFYLRSSPDGALIGASSAGSGVHTGISAPYGDGNGSTTFGIPDYRDCAIVGRDNMGGTSFGQLSWYPYAKVRGAYLGAQAHQLTAAQSGMPNHAHSGSFAGGTFLTNAFVTGGSDLNAQTGLNATIGITWASVSGAVTVNASGAANAAEAHPNVQPSRVCNVIIKY